MGEAGSGTPTPARSEWRENLAALVLGTVLTLLLFEGGLRVAGLFLSRAGADGEAEFTVLCEGDSFTYGIGGLSFPSQMEEVFTERTGRRVVDTVNEGVPGANTAVIADGLEAHIQQYEPDLILVLAGENNAWNAIRLSDPGMVAGWTGALDRALMHSRVYKFLKVASIGWRHARFHEAVAEVDDVERYALHLLESDEDVGLVVKEDVPMSRPSDPTAGAQRERRYREVIATGSYEDCVDEVQGFVEADPDYIGYRVWLSSCLMRLGRLEEAVDALRVAAELRPVTRETHDAYFQLGFALHRLDRSDEALEAWLAGLERFPSSQRLFQIVTHRFAEDGAFWKTAELGERIEGLDENPLYVYQKRLADQLGGQSLEDLISANRAADIRRMSALAASYGIPIVFASYPYHAYDDIEQAARVSGAGYIDFRPYFEERFDSREEYISPDNCHCNTKGYRLMAEVFVEEAAAQLGVDLPYAAEAPDDDGPAPWEVESRADGDRPGPGDTDVERQPVRGAPTDGAASPADDASE